MKKGRKLWEKTLAWVLAVVCCLSIVNLAPVAQKASAASTVTIYYHTNGGKLDSIWAWRNNNEYGRTGTATKTNGNWYKITLDDVPDGGFYFNPTVDGTDLGRVGDGDGGANYIPASVGTCYVIQGQNYIRTSQSDVESMTGETVEGGDDYVIANFDPSRTLLSEAVYSYETEHPNVVIDEIKDDNNGAKELFPVAAVMYNYKNNWNNSTTSNQATVYGKQFSNFNKAIMANYYNRGFTKPYVIGAFYKAYDTGHIYDLGVDEANLKTDGFDSKIGDITDLMWYYNHNLSKNKDAGAGAGVNASTMKDMVAGFLSNGTYDLVSSQSNLSMPYFDDNFLNPEGASPDSNNITDGKWATKFGTLDNPITFPFRVAEGGYYEFDSKSGTDNVRMGDDGKLKYNSSDAYRIYDIYDPNPGFYPFNTPISAESKINGGSNYLFYSDQNKAWANVETQFGFGVRMEIPFTISESDNEEITYTNKNITASESTTTETFTLETAGDYIVLNNANGQNINIDWISVDGGNTKIKMKDAVSNDGQTYYDEGDGVWGFKDKPGSIYFRQNVSAGTTVTVGYRSWGENSLNVGAANRLAGPTVFEFSGDDDLWVYVDGKLVLDMGGSHGRAEGSINFTTGEVKIQDPFVANGDSVSRTNGTDTSYEAFLKGMNDGQKHTLSVFYMERGLYDSNLKIRFNFKPIKLSASDAYFAEIGTPIEVPLNAEFVGQPSYDYAGKLASGDIKYIEYNGTRYDNLNDFRAAFGGTFNFDSNGKLTYKSNAATHTTAFKDKFVITFNDGSNSQLEIEVNNYKGNDDVYVIDYGIPVELRSYDEYDLFNNDQFSLNEAERVWEYGLSNRPNINSQQASKYTVAAVREVDQNFTVADTVTGNNGYGKAKALYKEYNRYPSYQYALDKFLDGEDTFYYTSQVVRYGTENGATLDSSNATPIMTSKVTILPANVIYYEDNFSYSINETEDTGKSIKYTGKNADDVVVDNTGIVTQSNSWDDLYGYDKAYEEQLTDSLGGSTKLGVLPTDATNGAMAEFTFKGTGFDIISRTSSSTAGVVYTVFNNDGKLEKYGMIDTNYKNGELYQLPVISVKGLDYGTHTVKVKAVRKANSTVKGIFYFDGIRIYNPANGAVDNYDHYKDSEKAAGFKSVRQMLLGNCTLSDTVIKNSSGAVVANITDIPECEATIEGPQITENHEANTSQSVDSLVASLASAPNNEVYLANNAKLKFKATPDDSVAEANRTLQIEAKLVRTGTPNAVANDENASATININGTDTVINSSTAMYYNIPATDVDADGKVNVEIKIDGDNNMPSNYALSITNLKYAGYTAFEPTATTGSLPDDYTYITAVTINGGQPVGYGTAIDSEDEAEIAAEIKANDRVNVELTFNAPVTVTTTTTDGRNTLKVNVNNNPGVYYFAGLASQGGDTPVSTDDDKKIALEVIAPKAAGNYTYEFVYTDAKGNEASKVVNLKVTAKTARR